MKRYFDPDGNMTGTSQSLQGGCAQGCLFVVAVFVLIVLIVWMAGH